MATIRVTLTQADIDAGTPCAGGGFITGPLDIPIVRKDDIVIIDTPPGLLSPMTDEYQVRYPERYKSVRVHIPAPIVLPAEIREVQSIDLMDPKLIAPSLQMDQLFSDFFRRPTPKPVPKQRILDTLHRRTDTAIPKDWQHG